VTDGETEGGIMEITYIYFYERVVKNKLEIMWEETVDGSFNFLKIISLKVNERIMLIWIISKLILIFDKWYGQHELDRSDSG
jgi:hypothetical protein